MTSASDPGDRELGRRLASLPEPQLAGLAARAMALCASAGARQILPRPDAGSPAPLSYAQERLWFMDQLHPGGAVYNISISIPFSGPLIASALARAVTYLAARHEALRTVVGLADGVPVQLVRPPRDVPLPVADLRALPAAEREAELERLATREANRPFDLSTGPLLRAVLVRLADDAHALLVTTHHIVSDGWSMGVLRRELTAAYAAFSRGAMPRLPPLPIQYADYAVWQRRWLSPERVADRVRHFREQLAGAPARLLMPADRPRPPAQGFSGAWRPVRISPALAVRAGALAREAGATPFMVLLAAYAAVLSRFSGQADVVVGTPVANRQQVEVEGLIGFFVNALPLRLRLSPGLPFRALVAQVREIALAAYESQDLPFERLVEDLRPERDLGHHPIFQASFAFQNLPTVERRPSGLSNPERASEVAHGSIKFDLSLHLEEDPEGGISGYWGVCTGMFAEASGERWASAFVRALEIATGAPGAVVADLVPGASPPAAPAPAAAPDLAAQIAALATEAPRAPAVAAEERRLTRRELAQRASSGTAQVPLEDSLELPVRVLAALRSGGGRALRLPGRSLELAPLAASLEAIASAAALSSSDLVFPAGLSPEDHALAVLAALAAGAGVVVGSRDLRDPDEIWDRASWEGSTVLVTSAPVAAAFARGTLPLNGTRWLVMGDELPAAAARQLSRRGATLWLVAGDPERAPWSAAARWDGSGWPSLVPVAAGRRLAVLDGAGAPVPEGAAGWLWAGEVPTGVRACLRPGGAVELAGAGLETPAPALDQTAPPPARGGGASPGEPPVKAVLRGIWAELLQRPSVGAEDDFFALGGHSLLAAQLASRVRDAFRVEVPLRQLFVARTVNELAAVLLEDPERRPYVERAAEAILQVARMSDAEVERALEAKGVAP